MGTTLSVTALFALSAAAHDAGLRLPLLAATLLAALSANLYVVGLNQLRDVELDRINKPGLPLASGELRPREARAIVAAAGVGALALAAVLGGWMLATVVASMAIGSLYSLPPMHLKRVAVGAAAAIGVVRGPIVNLGVFAHFQAAAGVGPSPSGYVLVLTAMMTCFGLAVAVAKDVPDAEGDVLFGVRSIAVVEGPRRALVTSVALISTGYALSAAAAIALLPRATGVSIALLHAALFATLLVWLTRVDALDLASTRAFYARLWRLFDVEYVAVALIGLAAIGAR